MRRFASFAATVLLLSLVCAAPALAHARLIESSPADGESVSGAPGQVQLRFNEAVEAEFEPVRVLNGDNERVDLDNAGTDPEDPEVVVVDLEEDLPEGSYTVDWRVTSVDGHPIGGTYAFEVTPAEAPESGPVATGRENERESSGASGGFPSGAVIGALLVGAVVFVGFVVFRRN